MDKIIFVPVGNKYSKNDLIDEKHRYNMIKIAIEGHDKLDVSDIEMNLSEKLDAVDAFKIIHNKYLDTENYYILGADNLYKMLLWKDFNFLVKNYKYIVVERDLLSCEELIKSNDMLNRYKNNFSIMENDAYIKSSATDVRKMIQTGNVDNIENYIPINVMNYINKNKLYS